MSYLRASIPAIGMVCALVTGGMRAQLRPAMPLGILEGRLASMTASLLEIDLVDGRTLSCAHDGRTYIDRDRQRLYAKDLRTGDLLELVTERHGLATTCFARMIHVATFQLRFNSRAKPGLIRRATETFAPRGDVLLTGVVRDLQPTLLEVKTRQDGPLRFRIRPDTLFIRDGREVPAAEVERTQPVFIRAGYTQDGELELYQVTWGAIVQPATPLPRPTNEPLY